MKKDIAKVNIIFHSADLDGWCSGAIARTFYEKLGYEIRMIPWNYGQNDPVINESEFIVAVDISLSIGFMRKVDVWIDHHKTAIEDSHNNEYDNISGSRIVGHSASLLAWKYFFMAGAPIEKAVSECPSVVYFVDRYDVWKNDDRDGVSWETVLEAQYGMRAMLKMPTTDDDYQKWKDRFDAKRYLDDDDILETGRIILNYQRQQDSRLCKARAFDIEFEGLIVAAINNPCSNSNTFKEYVNKDHHAVMSFSYDPKTCKWVVSLYGNNKGIDLSLIAKKYGGGGHANACGFSVDDINSIIKNRYPF